MSPSHKNSIVLVDTSVFIDYFRATTAKSEPLTSLLEESRVILSPFVRMELQMGVRARERKQLGSLLEALPLAQFDMNHFRVAESLMPLVRSSGLSVGLVDYLIAMQALDLQVPLFTLDNVMKKLAGVLEIEIF